MPTLKGDEFAAPWGTRLVRFRALTDEAIADDGTARRFVWATPLRPLAGRRLPAETVIFVGDMVPAERVP